MLQVEDSQAVTFGPEVVEIGCSRKIWLLTQRDAESKVSRTVKVNCLQKELTISW